MERKGKLGITHGSELVQIIFTIPNHTAIQSSWKIRIVMISFCSCLAYFFLRILISSKVKVLVLNLKDFQIIQPSLIKFKKSLQVMILWTDCNSNIDIYWSYQNQVLLIFLIEDILVSLALIWGILSCDKKISIFLTITNI